MSANNSCHFVGRLIKDPETTTVNAGPNGFTKTNFVIAVDKRLSAGEKAKKAQGQDVKDATFVKIEATGKQADVIAQYFVKGKPISVNTRYDEYSFIDNKTQDKVYGHKFLLDDFGFVPSDSTAQQQNSGGQNNYQQNQAVNNNMSNDSYQYPVSDGDMPF